MKKTIKICLPFLLLSVITFLSFSVYKKMKDREIVENNIASLPSVVFSTLKNEELSVKDLPVVNSKIIINYFSPDCEHCQSMARTYLQNAVKLSVVQIIMVTIADSAATVRFIASYKLNTMSNIIVLRDKKFQFEQVFGKSIIPSFFIYQNKKLLKKIMGETKIENLLNE